MELLKFIILGIIQGLTEFLPISSSGHLVITEHIFRINLPGIVLEVALHFASVIAIIFFLREKIWKILLGLFKGRELAKNSFNYLTAIIISIIPPAIVGVFLKEKIEVLFDNPQAVGISLLFTGGIVLSIPFIKRAEENPSSVDRSFLTALIVGLVVGVFQAFAIVPGISRSGATIFAGVLTGLTLASSADFAFIIAIPAILGAVIMEISDAIKSISDFNWLYLLVGFIFALIFSIIALKWLYSTIRKGQVKYFGIYCLILGFFIITYIAIF
ncbi:MAG: undecaprenyl-diphosphate phosphatase [bacterium]